MVVLDIHSETGCFACRYRYLLVFFNHHFSGCGSASKLRDFDDWQDPRVSTTDDDLISPYSDSSTTDLDQIRPQDLSKNGTYVIRKGRKKERKNLPNSPTRTKTLPFDDHDENRLSETKRYSSTFDNIKSLLKEGRLEGLNDPPSDFTPPVPPDLVRVVSLPAINNETGSKSQLEITVEEEESSDLSDKEKEIKNLNKVSPRLPLDDVDACAFPERGKECNDGPTSMSISKSLDAKIAVNLFLENIPPRKSSNERRLDSKIPLNLLIEDQIVKKALNENRRQLEKVSDAIKEIESVKNSESYIDSKRWRNGDVRTSSKRNSYENDQDKRIPENPFDNRPKKQYSSDSENSKTSSSEIDFDRRKLNGTEVYSSGRRPRQNGIESHNKNDQKQIENVIDAILEDSKNPDFQV